MQNKVHLIMPMGGAGSRFFKDGFVMPKPLIELKGKPFFYWATKCMSQCVDVQDITFVVLQEHINEFKIDTEIKKYFPDANIVVIPHLLKGAVLTCMEGVKEITDNNPIIFNDCDHIFKCEEFYNYCNSGNFEENDGALLSFESNDPKFSFLKLDENGYVIETVEKVVVSNNAICGAYYFKNKDLFLEMSNEYLEKCNYSEYFVSGVYNIMAEHGKKIVNFVVDSHTPFGTPDEYKEALESSEFEELE